MLLYDNHKKVIKSYQYVSDVSMITLIHQLDSEYILNASFSKVDSSITDLLQY